MKWQLATSLFGDSRVADWTFPGICRRSQSGLPGPSRGIEEVSGDWAQSADSLYVIRRSSTGKRFVDCLDFKF